MNLRKNRKLREPAKVDLEKATSAGAAAPLQTMVMTAQEPTEPPSPGHPKPAKAKPEKDGKWWAILEGARVLRSYKLHPAVLERLEMVAKVERRTMAAVVEEALIERIRSTERRYERETGTALPVPQSLS